MPQHAVGQRGDVLGHDVAAAAQQRQRPGAAAEGNRRAGAGAVLDEAGHLAGQELLGYASNLDEPAGVLDEGAVHVHRPRDALGVPDGVEFDRGRGAVGAFVEPGVHPGDHLDLLVGRRVAHQFLEHEPVGLRLGQRIRALLVDWVLRRHDEERIGQRVLDPCDRGLAFLHRLQHRALGLGARAVDLVEQHDVGVHRAELGDERVVGRLVDLGADDVARQQVGRALDAPEFAADGLGDHACCGGLGQAGHALDQQVTARQ